MIRYRPSCWLALEFPGRMSSFREISSSLEKDSRTLSSLAGSGSADNAAKMKVSSLLLFPYAKELLVE